MGAVNITVIQSVIRVTFQQISATNTSTMLSRALLMVVTSLYLYEEVAGTCTTVSGAKAGAACVFPFKARGVEYKECTYAGGYLTPWCSTQVDSSGNTVLGSWGDCPTTDPTNCFPETNKATTVAGDIATQQSSGSCTTIGGAQVGVACVFPFKARGVEYTSCTYAGGYSTPWCSTKVDSSGNTVLGNWGDCPVSDACIPPTEAPTVASSSAAPSSSVASESSTAFETSTVSTTTPETAPDGSSPIRG